MTKTQKEVVNIRLYVRSRNRFRKKADDRNMTLMDYLEEVSKKL